MKVCLITATCGRHYCIERSVRFSLNQTYENCIQLIYQNSSSEQQLDPSIPKGKVILVNNHIDLKTRKPYTNLGAIYRDALEFVPEDVNVVNFFDDDDIFLPNHVQEGIKGLIKGGRVAYKPRRSFYRSRSSVSLVNNTMEPSIFLYLKTLKKYGFKDTTSDQHLSWVNGVLSENGLYEDEHGTPTMAYNWGDSFPTYKTSGNNTPNNFSNYRKSSADHGDGVITPLSKEEIDFYYQPFKNAR